MAPSDPDTEIKSPSRDQPPSTSPSSQPSPSLDKLITHHAYAPNHVLQSYDLYIPPSPPSPSSKQKPWLIFLHGGAWRDPTITSRSFLLPTLHHLLRQPPSSPSSAPNSPSPSSHLPPLAEKFSGITSLSYRLSPHPSYPQPLPPQTPASEFRNARHPDHISDVLTGLGVLQREIGFGGRYVVVGHSCGGMMGWEVAMARGSSGRGGEGDVQVEVQPPMAIISICGIYDLPLLVSTHEDVPAYREFVTGAFGPEDGRDGEEGSLWERVSPARWKRYAESWGSGRDETGTGMARPRVAVLAYSKDDELVDRGQVEGMEGALRGQMKEQGEQREGGPEEGDGQIRFKVLELQGKHNKVWQDGREMVRAIEVAMDMLGM